MKLAPFDYFAPTNVDEVRDLLNQYGDDVKILAGGAGPRPRDGPPALAASGDYALPRRQGLRHDDQSCRGRAGAGWDSVGHRGSALRARYL
jgi:hypothetical protein